MRTVLPPFSDRHVSSVDCSAPGCRWSSYEYIVCRYQENPRETWRRQGGSAARQGMRPGHSRARAQDKAASARAAANDCGLELDPGS